MSKLWRVIPVLAATLMLAAPFASANQEEGTSFGIGVSSTTVAGAHVIGIGASVNIPFAAGRRAFTADGRYEFGNYKEEDSSPPPTEYEFKTTGYRFRVGVDQQLAVGDRGLIYFGPGVSYSSHKYKETSTGNPDFESEPYSVWGIASRLGVSVMTGESIAAFGQVEHTFGWGSYEEGPFKQTQTDVQTSYQGGVRIVFGTRQ